jgi:sugar lactone lactonase YvrE
MRHDPRAVAITVLALAFAACQPAPVGRSPSPTASARQSVLAACPAMPAAAGPQVLLHNQPAPDDLAFDHDGHLLFSDINRGTVSMLQADGSVQQLAGGLSEPEGIVVQTDGRILVAEQGRNQIVAIDPQSHAVSLWRGFANRTGNAGIDGIGPILPEKDASGQLLPTADDVIVPDSPNGVVWEVTPDGKTATAIATGMTRPVGAAIDTSGRIFVADEGNTLWILDPAKHRFATLPTPDDVLVARDGHIIVNTLGDNAIHELDAQGHQVTVLRGIAQPQGIALDGADNLYYTEFSAGRVDRVVRTFTLDPARVSRVATNTYTICPLIRRATTYTGPLTLNVGSSAKTSILQRVQPGTDTSGALEVQTSEPSVTISVSGSEGGGPVSLSQTVALLP